jgi:tetratricopeptide (TPR) repeat protein
MYLYANRKPLAIVHESLAGFVMVSRTSPVVIKLHGDARLAPRNTLAETQALDAQIQASVISILQETGLIFTGYGGNDNSILKMLRQLPVGKPPGGVYWINDAVPDGDFKKWLEEKNALWVTHRDFDELMLLILSECGLEHPQEDRFSKLIQAYRDRFKGLQDKVFSRPESRTQKFLKEAAQAAASRFKDWWSVHLEAERLAKTSPEAAERVYEDGANQFPNDTGLLGNFANFLNIVRKNYDKAEAFYKRAIESDPKHANNLGSYANFLKDVRKDYNQAEAFYKRAIESDPKHASHLGNYANFLKDVRKDYNQAEAFYKRAIESDPKNADNLGNYSGFLLSRGRAEEAWPLLERVYSLLPSEALRLECAFYEYAHSPDPNRRHQALRRAKELLIKGVRSPGWNLADNAVRAEADGHPNVPLLRNLAEVITKDAPLSDLEPFKEWTDIGG